MVSATPLGDIRGRSDDTDQPKTLMLIVVRIREAAYFCLPDLRFSQVRRWHARKQDRISRAIARLPPDAILRGGTVLAPFMSARKLCRELGINERTLQRWHDTGAGPPRTTIGRHVWYRRSSNPGCAPARKRRFFLIQRNNPSRVHRSKQSRAFLSSRSISAIGLSSGGPGLHARDEKRRRGPLVLRQASVIRSGQVHRRIPRNPRTRPQGEVDPEQLVAFAPDEHFGAYSYESELLTHDRAVSSLIYHHQKVRSLFLVASSRRLILCSASAGRTLPLSARSSIERP